MKIKKRIISTAAASVMAVSSAFIAPGCALGREITVVMNGTELKFEQAPKIVDGTTLVPMRGIFEELGMTVSWNDGSKTVTAVKNGKSAVITVGSKTAKINGETVELPADPVLENGTLMVPLRVISEALGVEVGWNDYTVTMTKTEKETDDEWKNNTGSIDLTSMTVSGSGLAASDNVIKITQGGDYTVSGTCADGMIYINTEDRVKLRLSGVNLTNPNGPAIFFDNCDKGFITISKDTENFLSDGAEYTVDAKGTIFSNDDLEIKGGGSLTVVSEYKHGIASDDDIKIEEGIISITAAGDGIHANDGVSVTGGTITITAMGDGIQSEDYVNIEGGEINVTTNGEVEENNNFGFGGGMKGGMDPGRVMGGRKGNMENPPEPPENGNHAEMPEMADNANPPMRPEDRTPPMEGDRPADVVNPSQPPENGAAQSETELPSTKGIKAETNLIISGGTVTVNSADHALHSAGTIFIGGGKLSLSSQKGKGISAHVNLVIDDGEIEVTKSTEGIESKGLFCINGGTVRVNASDDGLNAGGTNGRDVGADSGHSMYINGGYIYVNAQGDGLDSNGIMYILGGTTVVNGPTSSGNGALDSGGSIAVKGGTLIASGSSGMAEAPRSGDSAQPSFVYNMAQTQQAGDILRVEDSSGNEILTYRAPKLYQSIVYSSPELKIG
ncbi:MAG: carbohydrate-binding domain-containing protein, partial [Clostridia bacterium]